jgi:hypothetical protein
VARVFADFLSNDLLVICNLTKRKGENMKCSSCKSEWPDSVKFCGKCGARLNVSAGPDSPAAAEVNNRLKTYLPKLGIAQFREVRPGIHFGQKGSTHVEVRVIPLGPLIAVRSLSPVTLGTPITQDLLQFLLTENANMLFGAFGIGPKNEIIYTHTIMATSMDVHELGSSVSSVVNTADKYDDEIVKRWGGKTARDSTVKEVLTPVLLKALLAAKIRRAGAAARKPRPVRPAQPIHQAQPVRIAGIGPAPTIRKPAQPDASNAIKVSSIGQEYAHIAKQRCSCGGRYTRNSQALLEVNGRKYDQLSVTCAECGNEKQFLFDINSFFGKL